MNSSGDTPSAFGAGAEGAIGRGLVVDVVVDREHARYRHLEPLVEVLHRTLVVRRDVDVAEDLGPQTRLTHRRGPLGERKMDDGEVRATSHERVVATEVREQTDRPRRDLRIEVRTCSVLLGGERQDLAPRIRVIAVLGGRERDVEPGAVGDRGEEPELFLLGEPLAAERSHRADRR